MFETREVQSVRSASLRPNEEATNTTSGTDYPLPEGDKYRARFGQRRKGRSPGDLQLRLRKRQL